MTPAVIPCHLLRSMRNTSVTSKKTCDTLMEKPLMAKVYLPCLWCRHTHTVDSHSFSLHTVFRVPLTREMVANLLNPKQKKGVFDWITLGTMAFQIGLFFFLPSWIKRPLFIFIFFFWRLAYNAGLGVLLKYQSDSRGLVRLAKKYHLFDREANPKAYHWLQRQLSIKMGDDYDFAVSSHLA